MTQRYRKLIGVFLLLASLVVWVSVFTSIYLAMPEGLPGWVLLPYFVVAGVGWVFPAMAVIGWMAKPEA